MKVANSKPPRELVAKAHASISNSFDTVRERAINEHIIRERATRTPPQANDLIDDLLSKISVLAKHIAQDRGDPLELLADLMIVALQVRIDRQRTNQQLP
jgi:hypothetical protein